MKISVFGSYNGTSIGDTAILLGLLRGIAQTAPQAQVSVLTMGPLDLTRDLALTGLAQAPRLVRANIHAPAEWPLLRSVWWRLEKLGLPLGTAFNSARVRDHLRGQDMLLIGGGNLLMDLFTTGVDLIENITQSAQAAGCPYSFIGVGAGPVVQAASATRLAACLAPARSVVVRDGVSQDLCIARLARADTRCAPDLAFALPARADTLPRTTLAVNVAAVGAPTWPVPDAQMYRNYIDGMAQLVLQAAAQTHPDRIEIITTNPTVDQRAGQDLAALLADKTALSVHLPVMRDVSDILAAFGGARLAIVTRLHAGIMAALAGAPVLPVAYQPKVADVLRTADIAPRVIHLTDLHNPGFDHAAAVAQSVARGATLQSGLQAQAQAAIRDALSTAKPARGQR
jgi:polysaccharide pyruvyl transferase WcaK-like protein